jgi:geranylgeranyl diphosphate synthase, type II
MEECMATWERELHRYPEMLAAMGRYHQTWYKHVHARLLTMLPADDFVLREAVSYFISQPGKLYRPFLVLLSCDIVGGRCLDAIEASCAVELVHSSSLILDDLPCMDDAATRRGRPALHKRFGDAIAILSAVYLLNKAYEAMLDLGQASLQVLAILNESIGDRGMVTGQTMDLRGDHDLRNVISLKTGSLIKASVQIGARLGAAESPQQRALLNYAEKVGAAFQLRDDFMDRRDNAGIQAEAVTLAEAAADRILHDFNFSEAAFALAGMAMHAALRSV